MGAMVPENPSLEGVLQRMSSHLDGLAKEVHRVENVIGESVNPRDFDPDAIQQMQSLDHLRQSLEDLSLLSSLLSRRAAEVSLHETARQDIAAKLRLAVSRDLVVPSNVRDHRPAARPDVGEVDLF